MAEQGNWSLICELEGVQRRLTRLIDEVGTLPYSECLDKLNLTTLAERRIRGDSIEAFKAVNGFSSLYNILNISRSRLNRASKSVCNGSNKVKSSRRNFLTERVIKIWNKLPFSVKSSSSVNDLKPTLKDSKESDMEDIGSDNEAYFWRVSSIVLSKIEGAGYLENKRKHNEYLSK